MNVIFETDRLILREFTSTDSKFIVELLNSPGWLQYIGKSNVQTEMQAIQYLENGPMKSYRENGFGLSLVQLKDDNISIGMCGIIKRNTLENPDIGFAFLPDYTGKGYAYEIAKATLEFARTEWKLPVIFAITLPSNKDSIKLLKKIGLSYCKHFYMAGDDEELMLFSTMNS